MKIESIKYNWLFLVILSLFTSCSLDDFLQEDTTMTLPVNNFYSMESEVELAFAGIYGFF